MTAQEKQLTGTPTLSLPMILYKISAFSRLGQVSIKALRLYDQRGLLTPAKVDAGNGYRY